MLVRIIDLCAKYCPITVALGMLSLLGVRNSSHLELGLYTPLVILHAIGYWKQKPELRRICLYCEILYFSARSEQWLTRPELIVLLAQQ